MPRSAKARVQYAIATFLAAAPIGAGLIRLAQTRTDFRYIWLAIASYAGAYAVMRVGQTQAVTARGLFWLMLIASLVATLVDVLLGRLLGAHAMIGVWLVAVVFALFSATSQLFEKLSRRENVSA
ncbi:MAG TPA: hypothetical protein VGD02_06280 [Gemmatimonadaceae bacterium]